MIGPCSVAGRGIVMNLRAIIVAAAAVGLLAAWLSVAPAEAVRAGAEPIAAFPVAAMQENWSSRSGQGSCVYAALAAALRYEEHDSEASYVRQNYAGGAYWQDAVAICDKLDIAFDLTTAANLEIVADACRDGHVCVVGVDCCGDCVPYSPHSRHGGHALVVFACTADSVALYDSNHDCGPIRYVSSASFAADWQGWAVIVY